MKQIKVLILLLFISAVSMAQQAITLPPAELADKVIEEAVTHLGKHYRYGATGPDRFDCTGFTGYVYNKFGIQLKRSSKEQATDGREVSGSLKNLQKGDLLVFGSRRNKKVIGHIGIFIEMDSSGDNFTFIHACNRGVIISSLSETYYSERFLGARRVIPDFDSRGRKSQLDTIFIKASASDRQIVLFGDGTWSYLEKDGRLTPPNPNETITLDATGVWTTTIDSNTVTDTTSEDNVINVQGRIIPTLPPAENGNRTSDTLNTRNTDTLDANVNSEDTRNSKAKYHTIKKGDTLYSIARKYGTTVDKICDLNGITSKTILNVGRKLRVK